MKQIFIKTIKMAGYKTTDNQPTCTIGSPNCCKLLGSYNRKPTCLYDDTQLKEYSNGYLMVSKECPIWN